MTVVDDMSKFDGMTANERLFSLGLLDDYAKATRNKDVRKIQDLLARVGVEQGAIAKVIERLSDDDG